MNHTDHVNARSITVPEFGVLIKTLAEYLGGLRASFWLKAFKRFLRKENPWIPFQKVIDVGERLMTGISIEGHLEKLRQVGIDIFKELPEIEKEARLAGDCILLEAPLRLGIDIPQHSVVAVRVRDLLSVEERLNFTYQQLLDKARKEHGLDWCSLAQGLDAWKVIVEDQKNEDEQDTNMNCFICTKPFILSGNTMSRVPMISVVVGRMTKSGNERGYACMHAIDYDPEFSPNPLRKPNTVLLFRSIPY